MNQNLEYLGMTFATPLINAAGTVKYKEEFQRLLETDLGAIVIGSITVSSRDGNEGTTWHPDGINSLGMPNPGLGYYIDNLPEMVKEAHDNDKKVIVSIAGFNAKEYVNLAGVAFKCGADIVEINFGCPNVLDGGTAKPIYSFDIPNMVGVINEIKNAFRGTLDDKLNNLLIKLSPYSDPDQLKYAISTIDHVLPKGGYTISNTFPKGFIFDEHLNPAITPDGGLGGISGQMFKPIALGQVKQVKKILSEKNSSKIIVGAGGIATGRDMLEFSKVGASLMQIGTAFLRSNRPEIFSEILLEYSELVGEKVS
ncbi:MAG: hypothetical protein KA028_00065 [Candidatus Pacebacteria bacterium]|nr:hypothetical protein [Candidatus Paceibacterota bacterium]MBP9852162.1 hypothetical protein [Candidatus Paceibacterota bacterium]